MSSETIRSEMVDTVLAARDHSLTLTLWAGRAMVGIGVLHAAYFVVQTWPSWSGWSAGELRAGGFLPEVVDARITTSMMDFWSLPGGFVAPLVALGLLVARLAKHGVTVPAYVGWIVGGWALLCSVILEPSGFPLGVIPAALLLVARRRVRVTAER